MGRRIIAVLRIFVISTLVLLLSECEDIAFRTLLEGMVEEAVEEPSLSDAKAITSFVFTSANNAGLSVDATGTISGTAISAKVPNGTDVTALVPTITVSVGASVSPTSGAVQDFSSAVSYTVTAENNTTQVYTATVTELSDAKAITSFVFTAADNVALSADATGTISGTAISAKVPNGTDVTALVPTITVSVGASVSPTSGAVQDFSSAVSYTVTAENNTTQVYTATVTATQITVSPTSGLVTTEAGGAATFTVELGSQPTEDVTIGIWSSDTTEGTVDPPNLTFTSINWNISQTGKVTVTGVDDPDPDGNIAYTIFTAAASSADSSYNGIDPADVLVTNSDDDTVPILLSPPNNSATVDTTPKFDWQDSPGATEYHIQIDNDINFSSPIVDDNNRKSSTFTPASNLTDGLYYWHVKLKDGIWGNWCSTWSVTIDATNPIASFAVSLGEGWPLSGDIDVDASGSSDNLTLPSELQVRWDWENDGVWDTSYSTIKTASHIYTTAGPKTIKLGVKDNAENSSPTTNPIILEEYLKWGSYGSGDGQFKGPTGVAVDSSRNVFVVDNNNNRIQEFDSSGNFIRKWGSQGSGDGEFEFPMGVAVDLMRDVYVADMGNQRIQKFNWAGAFLLKWGSYGTGDGQFIENNEVAVDSSGNVYVTDSDNCRIQKFTSTGTFIGWWGKDDLGGIGWHNPGSGREGAMGSGDGQFAYPYGVAVDSSGNVYVTDMNNNRIQKFNSSGTFILKWGSYGSGDGQFNKPTGVAVDPSGRYVYVAERDNNRIQKFDPLGNFILKWGSQGAGDWKFNWPFGVAVDLLGNVYVADYNNNRIQKFGMPP